MRDGRARDRDCLLAEDERDRIHSDMIDLVLLVAVGLLLWHA